MWCKNFRMINLYANYPVISLASPGSSPYYSKQIATGYYAYYFRSQLRVTCQSRFLRTSQTHYRFVWSKENSLLRGVIISIPFAERSSSGPSDIFSYYANNFIILDNWVSRAY